PVYRSGLADAERFGVCVTAAIGARPRLNVRRPRRKAGGESLSRPGGGRGGEEIPRPRPGPPSTQARLDHSQDKGPVATFVVKKSGAFSHRTGRQARPEPGYLLDARSCASWSSGFKVSKVASLGFSTHTQWYSPYTGCGRSRSRAVKSCCAPGSTSESYVSLPRPMFRRNTPGRSSFDALSNSP